MITKHLNFFSVLIFSLFFSSLSAQNEFVEEGGLVYKDRIYNDFIKTVTVRPLSDPLGMPIIKLGTADRLIIGFDDLTADARTYNYKVIHCAADWTPSDLMPQEYINGYFEYFTQDFEYSVNTYVAYTHYGFMLPNENISFLKSGNYLLVMYEDDPEKPLFTRRFVVYEDIVTAGGEVKRATSVDRMMTHQEVDFFVNTGGYNVPNPFTDLKVTLIQNFRWDNAIYDLKPRFLNGNMLDYNYDMENNFEGGSEYRFFDLKSLAELTSEVQQTVLKDLWMVTLLPDLPRAIENYSYTDDINGQFVVRKLGSDNPGSEADYAYVDFFLPMDIPLSGGNLYVCGLFNFWEPTEEHKMKYNYEMKAYQARVLIKQGYYDYMYGFQRNGTLEYSLEEVEGHHWETRNDYTLLIYNRDLGARYDRVVGMNHWVDSEVR
ncbi:MAG: DUF5103 domain-containing protein [Schleiferiaceae bacterium]